MRAFWGPDRFEIPFRYLSNASFAAVGAWCRRRGVEAGTCSPAPVRCLSNVGLITQVGRGSGLALAFQKVILDALMRDATSVSSLSRHKITRVMYSAPNTNSVLMCGPSPAGTMEARALLLVSSRTKLLVSW